MRVEVTIAHESHATVVVEVPEGADWREWTDKELTAAALDVVEPGDWVADFGWVEFSKELDAAPTREGSAS